MQVKSFLYSVLIIILIVAGAFFVPWKNINWGKIQIASQQTITVSGEAKTQQKSQIATFSVGVNSVKDKKEDAINEVNTKMEEVMIVINKFNIDKKDIKTENLSIYQEQENYYDAGKPKTRLGQWRVSNSVSIILRDISKAAELTTELSKTGATNIYGPNYTVDNQDDIEGGLLQEAVKNARSKAEAIARANGKKLGEIVSVQEGTTSGGIFPVARMEATSKADFSFEPGSSTISKTVTVIFELK